MAKKIIGIISAKLSNNARIPNKILLPLAGKSMLAHHIERMQAIKGLEKVYVATSKWPGNEIVEQIATKNKCECYAGDENDIIERYIHILESEKADACIRIQCDSPLFDFGIGSYIVDLYRNKLNDKDYIYVKNVPFECSTMPELISLTALQRAHCDYRGPAVTLPIWERWEDYKIYSVNAREVLCRPEYDLAVDVPMSYVVMSHIYNDLYGGKPIELEKVYEYLDQNNYLGKLIGAHELSPINKRFIRAQKNAITGTDS